MRHYLKPPTFLTKVANPVVSKLGLFEVLEVPGRRSGTPQRVPLVSHEVDGHRYLVACRGETDWALNLRAAGRGKITRRGRTTSFRAVEVDAAERSDVIQSYLRENMRSVGRYFQQLPDDHQHPTFRIEPD